MKFKVLRTVLGTQQAFYEYLLQKLFQPYRAVSCPWTNCSTENVLFLELYIMALILQASGNTAPSQVSLTPQPNVAMLSLSRHPLETYA